MQKIAEKCRMFLWLPVFFAMVFSCGCAYLDTGETGIYYLPVTETEKTQAETEAEGQGAENTDYIEETELQKEPEMIAVYVCGAVQVPGVYYLPSGARAYQAVEAAGGFSEEARQEAVNLAAYIQDGQQLYIPEIDEQGFEDIAAAAMSDLVSGEEGTDKIDINYASKEELMQLPGIGEAKAEAIIEYRNEYGAFSVEEDIMLVPGIKEAAYSKLKDKIIVN